MAFALGSWFIVMGRQMLKETPENRGRCYRFPDGQEMLSRNVLRCRSFAWLTQAPAGAGFQVDPPDPDADDHVFLAAAAR